MTIRPILIHPEPKLRKKALPVTVVSDQLLTLADDMLETMYDAPGIGLAAPQVGVTKRIIVVDVSKSENDKHSYKMINPEIIWTSDQFVDYEEGCLSLPEQYAQVKRPEEIHLSYVDPEGTVQNLKTSGILATCIQHEIDHLDGKLFVDHISKLRRDFIIRKLKKYKAAL
jgi:peptide deformylase